MALSGSQSLAFTNYDTLTFSWTATQSVVDNASTVSWKLELISGKYGLIESSYQKAYTIVVDGNTYSGTNYINIGNNTTKTLVSGSTVIKHDANGVKTFNFSVTQAIKINWNEEYIGTKSFSGSGTLDDIPRFATLVNAPNLKHTATPRIQISNPAGTAIENLKVCISLTNSDTSPVVPYQSIPETDTYFTIPIGTSARRALAEAVVGTTSIPIYYILSSTLNGTTETSVLKRTYTIEGELPTMNPTCYDNRSITTTLTGDSSKFIKFYSTLAYNMNASGSHYATITGVTATYRGVTSTNSSGSFSYVEGDTIVFTATDSRNQTISKEVTLNVIDYIKLSCNVKVSNPTAAGSATVTVTGNYFNASFGARSNTLTVYYRIKPEGGSYGSWNSISATKSGNSYTATGSVTGLDYKTAYTVQAQAVDALATANSAEITIQSVPTFDWGKDDFNLNVELKMNDNTVLRATDEKKVVLSAEGADIYIRPNGSTTDTGQLRVTPEGRAILNGVQVATVDDLPPAVPAPADYIIEYGNNGSYGYRKWNSGRLEAWRTATSSLSASVDSALYGQMYYTTASQTLSTNGDASQFVTIQDFQLTLISSPGMAYPVIRSATVENGAAKITYYVANPLKATITVTPRLYIVGTWK